MKYIVGIDPGVETSLVCLDAGEERILSWAIHKWEWTRSGAWEPGRITFMNREMRDYGGAELEDPPALVVIEAPLDPAQWHGNPQAVAKCAFMAGIYWYYVASGVPDVRYVLPSEWLLSVANMAKRKARRPSDKEIWIAFWTQYAPQELAKEPHEREYLEIREQRKYEGIRDAAMIALYGLRCLQLAEKAHE